MTKSRIGKYQLRVLLLLIFLSSTLLLPPKVNAQQTTIPDQKFFDARELMDRKNLGAAREQFEVYISENPNGAYTAEAEYYAAFCALVLYHRDGEKLINSFIENHPGHPKTRLAFYDLGSHYYRSRNYPKTIEFLSKANLSQLAPADRNEANFMLGYSYFNMRKLDKALPYFKNLKRGNNEYSSVAAYYSGYINFESKNYKAAIADFDIAEKSTAYAAEIPYMKSSALYKDGQFDNLLSYAQNKISSGTRYSNRQILYLLSGEALFNKKDFEGAVEFYNEYQGMVRGRLEADVQYRIAYSKYMTGDFTGSLEDFKKISNTKGDLGVYTSFYLGVLYQKQDNKRYALTAFDKVRLSKIDSEIKEDASYNYAKLSYDVGNSMQAIGAMEEYIKLYPVGKYANEMGELLSDAYLSSNNYERAIKYIESLPNRSQNINKAYQKANFLQGTVLFNKQDYPGAVQYFNKSLEHRFDSETVVKALYWKGEAYSVGRRYPEALKSYREIDQVTRDLKNEFYLKSRYGLGYSYYNTQDYQRAADAFSLFVRNAGNTVSEKFLADAKIRFGDCLFVAKRYDDAKTQYGGALNMNYADRDYANLQIGIISMLQGSNDEATRRLDRVINSGRRSQYYDDGLFQKAQLQFNQTEYQQSVDLYSKLIQEIPSSIFVPHALIRRASAYFSMQQYDASVNDYIRVIRDHVNHEKAKDALLPLQEVLSALDRSGEYQNYLAAYKQANPDQKGLEEVEFESSKNFYFNQEYRKAISGLRTFVSNYPEDARVPESQFLIGDSYFRSGSYDSARVWLEPLSRNRSFWQYDRVIERMAELESSAGNHEQAAYFYGVSESMANDKRIQNQARMGRMLSYYELTKYDSAIIYAQRILESGGTNVNAENKASLYLGKSYFALGRYDQAKDEFLNTTNNAKDAYGAEAQYLIGRILYNNKEYRQSIEVLIDLNDKYQSYEDWIGKGFLLIADNYIGLKDYFQARGTLTSLIEYFPGEDVKAEARSKMTEVDALEEAEIKAQERLNTDSIVVDTLRTQVIDSVKNEDN